MGKMSFLCGPCRGVILKTSGVTKAVLGQFRSECSDIHVSRKLEERIEARSREAYKRSACENVKCELKSLFEVCDSVRLEYVKTAADRVKRLACNDCKCVTVL
jgi:hypothetical protein